MNLIRFALLCFDLICFAYLLCLFALLICFALVWFWFALLWFWFGLAWFDLRNYLQTPLQYFSFFHTNSVINDMKTDQLKPSPLTLLYEARFYTRMNMREEVLLLLKEHYSNNRMVNYIIKGVSKEGDAYLIEKLIELKSTLAAQNGIRNSPSPSLAASLGYAHYINGSSDQICTLFNQLYYFSSSSSSSSLKLTPQIHKWYLSSLAENGETEKSRLVLYKMRAPTIHDFNAVLQSYASQGNVQAMLAIYHKLEEFPHIIPNIHTWCMIAECYINAGRYNDMLGVINLMKSKNQSLHPPFTFVTYLLKILISRKCFKESLHLLNDCTFCPSRVIPSLIHAIQKSLHNELQNKGNLFFLIYLNIYIYIYIYYE